MSAFGRRFGLRLASNVDTASRVIKPGYSSARCHFWSPVATVQVFKNGARARWTNSIAISATVTAFRSNSTRSSKLSRPLPVRSIVAICCMRTSRHCTYRSRSAAVCERCAVRERGERFGKAAPRSRGAGIRRSIRAGRPEASTVSADASRRLMRHLVRRRVTNQALRPERRKHCQYRLRP